VGKQFLIQGVTFLAFGNGAPDIFTSMASVLGDNEPKVGLAIGGLVGE
jgi:sodium/potassium/calcium exchanger 6